MRNKYLNTLTTPSVEKARTESYGRARPTFLHETQETLGPEEIQFIAERDSFYLSSVGETGWPYIQHRGGPKGFLKAIGSTQLAFGDYNGNRQLLTTGNVAKTDRVSLFLMNYRARERLKIIGHAHVLGLEEAREIAKDLIVPVVGKHADAFEIDRRAIRQPADIEGELGRPVRKTQRDIFPIERAGSSYAPDHVDISRYRYRSPDKLVQLARKHLIPGPFRVLAKKHK